MNVKTCVDAYVCYIDRDAWTWVFAPKININQAAFLVSRKQALMWVGKERAARLQATFLANCSLYNKRIRGGGVGRGVRKSERKKGDWTPQCLLFFWPLPLPD